MNAARFFRIAQSSLGGRLARWFFTHMSFAIPVQRLRETNSLVAFHHPQPAYPLHILIVPKRAIPSFTGLDPEDSALLGDLIRTAQSLVAEFGLDETGYRLIVNGGMNQSIPLFHLHLIAERRGTGEIPDEK